MQSFFMQTTNTLIRLCGCAGWSAYSLDAHVRSHVFWRCGSNEDWYLITVKLVCKTCEWISLNCLFFNIKYTCKNSELTRTDSFTPTEIYRTFLRNRKCCISFLLQSKGFVKRKSAFEHAQNARIYMVLYVRSLIRVFALHWNRL